jgi:DNA polymerase
LPALDPAQRDALEARLRFYRELGITDFYRRPVDAAEVIASTEQSGLLNSRQQVPMIQEMDPPAHSDERMGDHKAEHATLQETTPIPPRKTFQTLPPIAPEVAPTDRVSALRLIRDDIGDCTRCALHKGRNHIVFADGDANARLMFVGEGPGADEDAQGLPFVGRAGQLLNNMIAAMGLKREEVYIANVVKCRPPQNRTPEPEEANTCSPFLFRQIDVVRPEVTVALGATAATYLLGQRQPLAGLRGRVHPFRGSKLIVTYHPAFLLRDPRQKKEAWADLQIAMRELGLKPAARPIT